MWRRNGLSIVLFALMAVFLVAQALTGWQVHNEELAQHDLKSLPFWSYLTTGHFSSATFENWESEFLQMGMYVLLTVRLRQAGSAESRPLDPAEEEPRVGSGPVPWPVRKGGVWKSLYGHSLAIVFFLLFFLSFSLQAVGSWRAKSQENRRVAAPIVNRSPLQQRLLV